MHSLLSQMLMQEYSLEVWVHTWVGEANGCFALKGE